MLRKIIFKILSKFEFDWVFFYWVSVKHLHDEHLKFSTAMTNAHVLNLTFKLLKQKASSNNGISETFEMHIFFLFLIENHFSTMPPHTNKYNITKFQNNKITNTYREHEERLGSMLVVQLRYWLCKCRCHLCGDPYFR